MKNKIVATLTLTMLAFFIFVLYISYTNIIDHDCYYSTNDTAKLKLIEIGLIVFNAFLVLFQIYSLIKNKQSKWIIIFSVASIISFLYATYQYKYNYLNIIQTYSELEKNIAPVSAATSVDSLIPQIPDSVIKKQQAELSKQQIESQKRYEIDTKKAIARRGGDSLFLVQNGDEVSLQFKAQKSFKINQINFKKKNEQFLQDGSGNSVTIRGENRYEVWASRYNMNEDDEMYQPIIIAQNVMQNECIEEIQHLGDFEGFCQIAIGLKRGYKLVLKKDKLIIVQ